MLIIEEAVIRFAAGMKEWFCTMNRPDTLQEMEALLASIREAIETHTGEAAVATAAHDGADTVPVASAAPGMNGQPMADAGGGCMEEDILWAEEEEASQPAASMPSSREHRQPDPARQELASERAVSGVLAQAGGNTAATGAGLVRPAWATSSGAAIGAAHARRQASAAVTHAVPAASPHQRANLRLVKTETTEERPARQRSAPSAPSFLPREVQQRVKAAMSRLERIEAAKRALGGERALRQLVSDIVEPVIAEWLSEHLPDIVERRVAAELARLRGQEE